MISLSVGNATLLQNINIITQRKAKSLLYEISLKPWLSLTDSVLKLLLNKIEFKVFYFTVDSV